MKQETKESTPAAVSWRILLLYVQYSASDLLDNSRSNNNRCNYNDWGDDNDWGDNSTRYYHNPTINHRTGRRCSNFWSESTANMQLQPTETSQNRSESYSRERRNRRKDSKHTLTAAAVHQYDIAASSN